jgi:hypothetical protein
MLIELYVAVEVNDDAAAVLDSVHMGGATGAAIDYVRNSLREQKGFSNVTVDVAEVADGSESDGEEIDSDEGTDTAPPVSSGLSARQVARAAGIKPVRSAPPAVKGGLSGRTGRPATLHNLRAADGEPVRASGPRSREVLESQGIAVWDVDAGETGPVVKPKNTGERTVPARAGKPVMKRRQ